MGGGGGGVVQSIPVTLVIRVDYDGDATASTLDGCYPGLCLARVHGASPSITFVWLRIELEDPEAGCPGQYEEDMHVPAIHGYHWTTSSEVSSASSSKDIVAQAR